mgnify:CR=1 FL=1
MVQYMRVCKAQKIGRMICCNAVVPLARFKPFAAVAGNAHIRAAQIMQRYTAQRHNYFRLQNFQFFFQPALRAKIGFGNIRRTVSFGAAFYYIGCNYSVPCHFGCPQSFVQKLSGRANQRAAVIIFDPAGAFSYKYYRRSAQPNQPTGPLANSHSLHSLHFASCCSSSCNASSFNFQPLPTNPLRCFVISGFYKGRYCFSCVRPSLTA